MKKKTLVPLIIFLLGICLVSLIVYKTDAHEKEQRHITAQLNVATYGERIKNEITNGIEITDTLKQILISEDGEIRQFETIAGNLMSDSIESVQLAPNGVVTDIYPANENEAGKIDLIHDKDRGKISCYARDNHTIITQGPFKLKQGGYGIAVRNPIYLNGNENDYTHFHLRKADGTYFSVLDHGRIVESPQYGKVFYVLFMDWEDMHIRYNDKFAR